MPILVGGGLLDDAMFFVRGRTIIRSMLAEVDQATRDRAMESVYDALARHADGNAVRLTASIWLVTARR
jgi:hypothetical protein